MHDDMTERSDLLDAEVDESSFTADDPELDEIIADALSLGNELAELAYESIDDLDDYSDLNYPPTY